MDVPAGSGLQPGCRPAAGRQLTSCRLDVGAKNRRASAGRLQHTLQPALAGTCAVRPGLASGTRYRRRTGGRRSTRSWPRHPPASMLRGRMAPTWTCVGATRPWPPASDLDAVVGGSLAPMPSREGRGGWFLNFPRCVSGRARRSSLPPRARRSSQPPGRPWYDQTALPSKTRGLLNPPPSNRVGSRPSLCPCPLHCRLVRDDHGHHRHAGDHRPHRRAGACLASASLHLSAHI